MKPSHERGLSLVGFEELLRPAREQRLELSHVERLLAVEIGDSLELRLQGGEGIGERW